MRGNAECNACGIEMSLSSYLSPCHAPAKWDAQGHVPADNKSGSTTAEGGEGSRVKGERALDGGEVGFGHELLSLGRRRQAAESAQTILTR
jgi:hypothetical protein